VSTTMKNKQLRDKVSKALAHARAVTPPDCKADQAALDIVSSWLTGEEAPHRYFLTQCKCDSLAVLSEAARVTTAHGAFAAAYTVQAALETERAERAVNRVRVEAKAARDAAAAAKWSVEQAMACAAPLSETNERTLE